MLGEKEFWLGIASVALNAAGYYPYIGGILRGNVKPQRITWGIWTILTTIAFVNQVINGGGYSTFFFGSTALLVLIVFILSIKRGIGGRSNFDITVLIASFALFVLWAVTKDTRTTTLIAVAIDFVGALPTVYKTFMKPETEVYLQWILAAVSGFLAMLAIGGSRDYILFAYPFYVVVMNSVIVLAKFAGTKKTATS
jgi:hypothetical protein